MTQLPEGLPEAERTRIRQLAADVERRRQVYEAMGLMNANVPPDQRIQQSQDYAVALAEMNNAQALLDEAVRAKK